MSSCSNDSSKANLHMDNKVTFIVNTKATQEKATSKFSPHVFKSPTLKGLMTVNFVQHAKKSAHKFYCIKK